MRFSRSSGILLHPTSLPGPYGIGELGPHAYEFVNFLGDAGQKIWQVLPLNPTGYGDSPYQSFSAFAGNPLLISLETLLERGILQQSDLAGVSKRSFPDAEVDFGAVIASKFPVLRNAACRFLREATAKERAQFAAFCEAQAAWLDEYALFMAAKDHHGGAVWNRWDCKLAQRDPGTLASWRERLAESIAVLKYWQFEFFRQWHALKDYCHSRGIRIMGDLPIYVAHDSADVWANSELFDLCPDGSPARVAGVPPDYFSATGQLWGNPLYRWEELRKRGYSWWIDRLRAALTLYDQVRLDHFRGFAAYWEVDASEPTAVRGRWTKGPGAELFSTLQDALGQLPIVAENLGVITPDVEAIRNEFGFPGMAILQFGFGTDPQAPSFRPHNYVHELVAYTGGHDNDTLLGWWNSGAGNSTRSAEDVEREHKFARDYLGLCDGDDINWAFIRAVTSSVADTVLIPLQDVLGCGTEGRMNVPGRLGGNWKWRFRDGDIAAAHATRLRELVRLYER